MALRGIMAVLLVFVVSTMIHFAVLLSLRWFSDGGQRWRRQWVLAFLVRASSPYELLSSAALLSVADLPLVLLSLTRFASVGR